MALVMITGLIISIALKMAVVPALLALLTESRAGYAVSLVQVVAEFLLHSAVPLEDLLFANPLVSKVLLDAVVCQPAGESRGKQEGQHVATLNRTLT